MKKTQKWMISLVILSLVTALLSWNQHDDSRQTDPAYFKNALNQNEDESSFEANMIARAEDDDRFGSPSVSNKWLPAQDVLIQKIQGDNSHVLMMAFYSKENYPGPSVTIENAGQIVFKDDGKEYDKQAGDGLYT